MSATSDCNTKRFMHIFLGICDIALAHNLLQHAVVNPKGATPSPSGMALALNL